MLSASRCEPSLILLHAHQTACWPQPPHIAMPLLSAAAAGAEAASDAGFSARTSGEQLTSAATSSFVMAAVAFSAAISAVRRSRRGEGWSR